MTEILLKKELGGLRPASDDAYRVLEKIRSGATVVADVRDTSRRSGQQHRFFFALLNTLFESQEYYKTLDHFRQCLLIHLGFAEIYRMKDGRDVAIAHSLKLGKMPGDEFNSLIESVLTFAEGMGFDRHELLAATQEFAA